MKDAHVTPAVNQIEVCMCMSWVIKSIYYIITNILIIPCVQICSFYRPVTTCPFKFRFTHITRKMHSLRVVVPTGFTQWHTALLVLHGQGPQRSTVANFWTIKWWKKWLSHSGGHRIAPNSLDCIILTFPCIVQDPCPSPHSLGPWSWSCLYPKKLQREACRSELRCHQLEAQPGGPTLSQTITLNPSLPNNVTMPSSRPFMLGCWEDLGFELRLPLRDLIPQWRRLAWWPHWVLTLSF